MNTYIYKKLNEIENEIYIQKNKSVNKIVFYRKSVKSGCEIEFIGNGENEINIKLTAIATLNNIYIDFYSGSRLMKSVSYKINANESKVIDVDFTGTNNIKIMFNESTTISNMTVTIKGEGIKKKNGNCFLESIVVTDGYRLLALMEGKLNIYNGAEELLYSTDCEKAAHISMIGSEDKALLIGYLNENIKLSALQSNAEINGEAFAFIPYNNNCIVFYIRNGKIYYRYVSLSNEMLSLSDEVNISLNEKIDFKDIYAYKGEDKIYIFPLFHGGGYIAQIEVNNGNVAIVNCRLLPIYNIQSVYENDGILEIYMNRNGEIYKIADGENNAPVFVRKCDAFCRETINSALIIENGKILNVKA